MQNAPVTTSTLQTTSDKEIFKKNLFKSVCFDKVTSRIVSEISDFWRKTLPGNKNQEKLHTV